MARREKAPKTPEAPCRIVVEPDVYRALLYLKGETRRPMQAIADELLAPALVKAGAMKATGRRSALVGRN